jgi:hypothetical protein
MITLIHTLSSGKFTPRFSSVVNAGTCCPAIKPDSIQTISSLLYALVVFVFKNPARIFSK